MPFDDLLGFFSLSHKHLANISSDDERYSQLIWANDLSKIEIEEVFK